jgi:sugar lactone lactonase YvrE
VRIKLLILPAALAAAIALTVAANGGASAQAPGPSAGTVLVAGLLQPKGLEIGPDGALYVAESGTGGDTEFEIVDGGETFEFLNGYTGRISRIDPDTGVRTTVVDGLPSNAFLPEEPGGEGEAVGPTDVAFISGNMYYLQTHGGDIWGFQGFETGIYRVADNGDLTLVADIGAFNAANPVDAITSGVQVDIEPGGNPYSMDVHNNSFYVSDGNHNRLLRITTGGTITAITEFPNHPVSTGMDFSSGGVPYVSLLGQGPFPPDQGKVVSVNVSSGVITEHASGVSMLTDVEFGPGGQLYALSFNDTTAGEFPAFGPFTGSIQKVNPDGTMSPLVTGLSFATFLAFDDETAYVSNWGVTSMGEIVKIENFSSVEPPAPAPTAAATQAPAATATPGGGTIGAPDTGDGSSAAGGGAWLLPLVLLGAAGAAFAVSGTRLFWRRGQ